MEIFSTALFCLNCSFLIERIVVECHYRFVATITSTLSDREIDPVETVSLGEGGLSELEIEVIDLFVGAARLFGFPKSVAQIYGLLFLAPEPLPLDEITSRLQISKGSVSQGLKFLRSVSAIKPVFVPGDRRDHFRAVAELKQLASGFIKEELEPHIETGTVRLERLRSLLPEGDADPEVAEHLTTRVERLENWHGKAKKVLPLVGKLLG